MKTDDPNFRKAFMRVRGGFEKATDEQILSLYHRLPVAERRRIHGVQGSLNRQEGDHAEGTEPERDVSGSSEE